MASRSVVIAVAALIVIAVAGLGVTSLYMAPTTITTTTTTQTTTTTTTTQTTTNTTTTTTTTTTSIIPPPKPESKLLIYGVADPQDTKPWFDAFKAKYPGVEVEYVNAIPGNIYTRIKTEVDAKKPTADLVMITLPLQLTLLSDGVLEAYKTIEAAAYPTIFKDAAGYWTAVQINPIIQVYNPKTLSQADLPKTLDDLVNSKWNGKFTIHDITAGTVGTQWLATLNQTIGKDKWTPFVENLIKNVKPARFTAFEDVGRKVAEGEYLIGLSAYAHDYLRLKNQGASLEMFRVTGLPVLATVSPVSLLKNASHPIAAKLFIDFILSVDGQKLVGNTEVRIAARPGVDTKYTAEKALPGISFLLFPNDDALKNNVKYRDYFRALYGV